MPLCLVFTMPEKNAKANAIILCFCSWLLSHQSFMSFCLGSMKGVTLVELMPRLSENLCKHPLNVCGCVKVEALDPQASEHPNTSVILFMSMAACFISQTYTQVEQFLMGQVVHGTDTYGPDVVQLPTLLMCREILVAVDKSLLELKGLPSGMFSDMPPDLNVVIQIPFPWIWSPRESMSVAGLTQCTLV